MTREATIKAINAANDLKGRIAALDRVIDEVATSGFSSATISAGSGSKSYTRADLAGLREQREDLIRQYRHTACRISGKSAHVIGKIHHFWS